MGLDHKCEICGASIGFEGICYECRMRIKREDILLWDENKTNSKVQSIINLMESTQDWHDIYEDFLDLLALKGINTESIGKAACENNIFYPPQLFVDASADVRDRIIDMLLNPKCENPNDLLQALAIVGDNEVLETFIELEKTPLKWREKLYVDPSQYAHTGGWTFDKDGIKRELVYEKCYTMLPSEREDNAIILGQPLDDKCDICGCQIIDLMQINGDDERLSMFELKGNIRLPICPNCAMMSEKINIYIDNNGNDRQEIIEPFGDENYLDKEDLEYMKKNTLTLSEEPVPMFYSNCSDDVITVGGMPEWVQDTQYEQCPKCNKTMKLFANISWVSLMGAEWEGVLYIEYCPDCKIFTALHQQT